MRGITCQSTLRRDKRRVAAAYDTACGTDYGSACGIAYGTPCIAAKGAANGTAYGTAYVVRMRIELRPWLCSVFLHTVGFCWWANHPRSLLPLHCLKCDCDKQIFGISTYVMSGNTL